VDTQNTPAGGSPAGPVAGETQTKRPVPLWRIGIFLVVGVIAGVLIYFSPRFFSQKETVAAHSQLKMGGTNTLFVVVENQWKKKYRDEKGVELDYVSTGSTAGVDQLLEGKSSVAFTHGALSPEQRQKAKEKGGDVVHIPVLFFGVAPVYNVKELKDKPPLNLTGELLADIFMGKITKWKDPAIEKINPGVVLPDIPITVVHRSDSSGTTLVFTEYLDAATAANGAWRNKMGKPASRIEWPAGPNFVGADRNLKVAETVNKTEGAIGYVDRMYTTYDEMKLDYAAIQNKDKSAFVRAEPENMTAAVAGLLANLPDDLVFDLADKPGKDAYPISGAIYAVCFQNQPGDKRQQVVDFLHWAVHEGQPAVAKMTYAPLPPELVKRVDQKLETIK
jgi:phosphate transport system substrate-binding protein